MTVLLKAHILTGCDITSKIGTKNGALKANPEKYLKSFGESDLFEKEDLTNVEEYLVKVLHPSSPSRTFNELRFELYIKKKVSLIDLPPTSSSLAGHLLRSYYVIRQYIQLLDNDFEKDIKRFGWLETEEGTLIPDKELLPLPDYYTVTCGCQKTCKGNCKCRRIGTDCTEFCACRATCV